MTTEERLGEARGHLSALQHHLKMLEKDKNVIVSFRGDLREGFRSFDATAFKQLRLHAHRVEEL